MAATMVNRRARAAKARRRESQVAVARRARESGALNCGDLPSRAALVARLEAQRAELLRAMSDVNLARRTIEAHIAHPSFGEPTVSPAQYARYRQRALAALNDAGEALRTAYPMLERIAQALAAEEILKEHASEPPSAPAAQRSAAQG